MCVAGLYRRCIYADSAPVCRSWLQRTCKGVIHHCIYSSCIYPPIPVQVTFAPIAEGVYNGVVSLQGSLVVSSAEEPLATVKLCGCAEAPRLTMPSSQSLDYGTVVGGSVVRLPLELSNAGSSLLPLKITINCNVIHNYDYTTTVLA